MAASSNALSLANHKVAGLTDATACKHTDVDIADIAADGVADIADIALTGLQQQQHALSAVLASRATGDVHPWRDKSLHDLQKAPSARSSSGAFHILQQRWCVYGIRGKPHVVWLML